MSSREMGSVQLAYIAVFFLISGMNLLLLQVAVVCVFCRCVFCEQREFLFAITRVTSKQFGIDVTHTGVDDGPDSRILLPPTPHPT